MLQSYQVLIGFLIIMILSYIFVYIGNRLNNTKRIDKIEEYLESKGYEVLEIKRISFLDEKKYSIRYKDNTGNIIDTDCLLDQFDGIYWKQDYENKNQEEEQLNWEKQYLE